MKHAPRLTLLACVAACLAYVYSCQATSNTLARWGGAAAGAGLGAAVGGPLGAGVGALAGDAGGDALVQDPPTTVVNASPGSTVYATPGDAPVPWRRWAVYALVLLALVRFRAYLLGFVKTLATGGLRAAGMNLLALVAGGNVGAKAKEATMFHAMTVEARKHRRKYPNRPVSPQNPETFDGVPHV